MSKLLKVTLLGSGIGRKQEQKDTLRGLGLTRRHKTVYLENTSSNRGMVNTVIHLVKVDVATESQRDVELEALKPQPSYRVVGKG